MIVLGFNFINLILKVLVGSVGHLVGQSVIFGRYSFRGKCPTFSRNLKVKILHSIEFTLSVFYPVSLQVSNADQTHPMPLSGMI